jgi:FtsP/CotA-like multicopper oxidase with cupredoxin domain
MNLSRRSMLLASAATAARSYLPGAIASAASARKLTATKRAMEVNGRAASMFALQGASGEDGVTLAPGERFAVTLENQCGEPTIIHWHGQTPPVSQDGVTDTGYEAPIANGAASPYDYAPRPGTFWMHSHLGLQEQRLMAAPLIVHTADDVRADVQEVVVLLHDFTFEDPEAIFARLTRGGRQANQAGMGMMSGSAMMRSGSAAEMPMSGNACGMAMGCGADLNDIDFDAYLANGRTLEDPQVVRVERGGQVRLRLINGATATSFWISTGILPAQLIAVDGDPVHPLDVSGPLPLAEAQRVDLMLRLPAGEGAYPIFAQREGDIARTGILLATSQAQISKTPQSAASASGAYTMSLETALRAQTPLANRPVDRVHQIVLAGGMMRYNWTINGRQWQNHVPLQVKTGERVAFDLFNRSMMSHPMHLHGHRFQVIEINGIPLSGAFRDTVLVPAMGHVRIAFDADNPGRWLFHCHNLYHMRSGMMTELRYG